MTYDSDIWGLWIRAEGRRRERSKISQSFVPTLRNPDRSRVPPGVPSEELRVCSQRGKGVLTGPHVSLTHDARPSAWQRLEEEFVRHGHCNLRRAFLRPGTKKREGEWLFSILHLAKSGSSLT